MQYTSLCSAADADPQHSGSKARRKSNSLWAEGGKSLNVSPIDRLYGCWGLKIVACGSFDFFQYSSDGEPQSLNILCSCSTCAENRSASQQVQHSASWEWDAWETLNHDNQT